MNKLKLMTAILFVISTITLMSFQKREIEKDIRCRMESIPLQAVNIEAFHKYVTHLYNDGSFEKEMERVVNLAINYATDKSDFYKNHNPAIVFDLDETLLSNFNEIKKMNFAIDWNKISYDSCTIIKPVFNLYKYAIENNIAIIFITARNEKVRKSTVNNMNKLGIAKWDTLFMMPKDIDWSPENAQSFKLNARKAMTEKGYSIMFSIGDKHGDLIGGYCDTTFKLINLLY